MLVRYRSVFPSRQRFVLVGGLLSSFVWLIAFPDKIHAQFSLLALFALFGWLALVALKPNKAQLVTQTLCGVMIFSVLVYPGGIDMTTGLYDVTGVHWVVRVAVFVFAVALLGLSKFRGRHLVIPAMIGVFAVAAGGHFRLTPVLTDSHAGWSKFNMLTGNASEKRNPDLSGLNPLFTALGDSGTVTQDTIYPMAFLKPKQVWTSKDHDPPSFYIGNSWTGHFSLPNGLCLTGKLTPWRLVIEGQKVGIYRLRRGKPTAGQCT